MDTFYNIIQERFVWGLAIGLGLAFFTWKSGLSTKLRLSKDIRRLENDMRELQAHLNTQLKINAQGNHALEKELERIREQNENLRVSLATAQTKPGRAEMRQFLVMEAAVRQMREQAPGFAPAWEKALRQAEADVEASDTGIKRLVRKVIPGIGMTSSAVDSDTDKEEQDRG